MSQTAVILHLGPPCLLFYSKLRCVFLVKVWRMVIYDFKEFLDIEDVAGYLKDEGVCSFDLMEHYDRYIFNDLMESLIFEDDHITT